MLNKVTFLVIWFVTFAIQPILLNNVDSNHLAAPETELTKFFSEKKDAQISRFSKFCACVKRNKKPITAFVCVVGVAAMLGIIMELHKENLCLVRENEKMKQLYKEHNSTVRTTIERVNEWKGRLKGCDI